MTRVDGLAGSFWPTQEEKQLLRLAFARPEQVSEVWREFQSLRIETLGESSFCVLPLAYARLLEAEVEDERLPRLKGIYQSVWYRNQLLLDSLTQLVDALRSAHVEPVVLGGIVLATRYYPQLALRPAMRLELAVAPGERQVAAEAILRLGWRSMGDRMLGATHFGARDGAIDAVLHAGAPRFFAGPLAPGEALERLRARGGSQTVGAVSVQVLDPAAELLLACASGARRTVPQIPQWLLDTHRILQSVQVEPTELAAQAASFHLVPALRDTLLYLLRTSETLDVAPWLEPVQELPVRRRDELVHGLAGAGDGRFGAPPAALVAHLRATLAAPLPRVLHGLPRAFRQAWGLGDGRILAVAAARKAAHRLVAAARRPGDTRLQPAQSVESRNRSASS